MLLGDICTRACGFCSVKTGKPAWFDDKEPTRIAEAVMRLKLNYIVLTSVNRDDLADGGAWIFAESLRQLRRLKPDIGVEFLTPDFRNVQHQAIRRITDAVSLFPLVSKLNATGRERGPAQGVLKRGTQMAGVDTALAQPENIVTNGAGSSISLVWGHNVETVPRLYKIARKGSQYGRSLALLEQVARQPGIAAKSALMLGLGESREEIIAVLKDLRQAGVSRVALGQYLRPTMQNLPVAEYVAPGIFDELEHEARALGFDWVKAGPLVRSSYYAEEIQQEQQRV
jgi:lipoic acid synthetase